MKDLHFEAQLVAATTRRSDDTNNFVKDTMSKIKATEPHPWLALLAKLATLNRVQQLALGALAVLVISTMTFTGYAYAIGSDPVTVLKRWIEGDKVKIEYDGRVFEHGRSRNYSDAAVTAFAEINTVNDLAFKAMQAITVPKDGVEYVTDIFYRGSYGYPYIASIDKVEGGSVSLTKRYIFGDKMNPSHTVQSPFVLTASELRFYKNGEPATPTPNDVGTLVMMSTQNYIAHTIGTSQIKQVVVHFTFALSHDLNAFMEADKANAEGLKQVENDTVPLYEPGWGAVSTTCMNNGADVCNDGKLSRGEGQGLYDIAGEHGRRINPSSIPYGEAVPTINDQPFEILPRQLQGKIIAIDNTYLTLETSSGAHWRLEYSQAKRQSFTQLGRTALQVGDKLSGIILQSVRQLDDRVVDDKHMSDFVRV